MEYAVKGMILVKPSESELAFALTKTGVASIGALDNLAGGGGAGVEFSQSGR